MSKINLDSEEISLPCPKCRRETKRTIGRARRDGYFTCAGCGARVDLDLKQFDQQVRSINQSLEQMLKPFR